MGSVDHVFVFVHVCLPYVCSCVGESWQIDQLWRSFGTAARASVFISRLTFIPRQRRGVLKGEWEREGDGKDLWWGRLGVAVETLHAWAAIGGALAVFLLRIAPSGAWKTPLTFSSSFLSSSFLSISLFLFFLALWVKLSPTSDARFQNEGRENKRGRNTDLRTEVI